MAPCRRRAPVEYAAGITPRHGLSSLGVAKRLRSPIAATIVTATGHCTPRSACGASATGGKRHDCTCSWRTWSRRWRRVVCSVTARTYSCKTLCGAGVGQTTAERHRRGARCQWARPVERISWRNKKAVRRNVASLQSLRGSDGTGGGRAWLRLPPWAQRPWGAPPSAPGGPVVWRPGGRV
jgi:hypothetical protein